MYKINTHKNNTTHYLYCIFGFMLNTCKYYSTLLILIIVKLKNNVSQTG